MLRLRQVCIVVRDRDAVVSDLENVFGIRNAFDDPAVRRLGLHNAVLPVGDQFIEVIAPVTDGTAAQRHLDRRGGDGGYMLIFQTDDHAGHRARVDALGIRVVADYSTGGFVDMQLHPSDTGGTFVEIDQQTPPDEWHPAGPDWRSAVGAGLAVSLDQADVGCADPESVSDRWGALFALPVTIGRNCGMHKIRADNFCVRFVPAGPRGDGIDAVNISVTDAAEVQKRATARGLSVDDGSVTIGGVRFVLV